MLGKLIALLCACVGILHINNIYFNKCTTRHFEEVCNLVRKSPFENEFCQKLCKAEALDHVKCHSVRYEKSVHEVVINGEHLVLKYRKKYNTIVMETHPSGEFGTFLTWNSSMWTLNYFGHCKGIYAVEPVQQTAGQIFGNADSSIELLPDLPEPFSAITDLLSQQLVKFSLVRNLIEYARTAENHVLEMVSHILSQKKPSFKQRVSFTRDLFAMLEDMHVSSNGQIVMCDVHLDNFGYTKTGNLKVIDADDVYTMEDASSKLINKICETDEDCMIGDFSDCFSHCNHETSTCSPVLAIPNVRNICSVLLSLIFNDLTEDHMEKLRTVLEPIGNFSKSYAVSLDDEILRIRRIIELLDGIII